MFNLGSIKEDIVVVIGPCISQKSYEVGKDFKDKFIRKNKKNSMFFKYKKKKIYFDLRKFIYKQLISFGIFKIKNRIYFG